MSKLEEIASAIEAGKVKQIAGLVEEALDAQLDPLEIMNRGMIDAMASVGLRFQAGELYVPEMLIAARAMKKGMEALKPYLPKGEAGAAGKVIIGTVSGDLHDIGKNLVAMMIESAGFEIIDLGVDVPPELFVDTLRDHPDARIVALSALLTTSMSPMRETVRMLRMVDGAERVKIMVGGAPITEEFAGEIGADAYAPDAAAAAQTAKRIVA